MYQADKDDRKEEVVEERQAAGFLALVVARCHDEANDSHEKHGASKSKVRVESVIRDVVTYWGGRGV